MLRTILFLVVAVIILIGLYYHVQNTAIVVVGGAITVIVAHLVLVGGAAHIIRVCFKCLNHRQAETEPVEVAAVTASAFDRLRRRLGFK